MGDFNDVQIPNADSVIRIRMMKNMLAKENFSAVKSAKRLLTETHYDIVSTHTALAGAIIRLAVKLKGKKCSERVVHTSHGYFFNGNGGLIKSPYLLVEKFLSDVTDILMVMNNVDYHLAMQHKLGSRIELIPGMGIEVNEFNNMTAKNKKKLRIDSGYELDDFLIVYAAEMSKRKNQGELIRAFASIARKNPQLKLLLAGEGALKERFKKLSHKLGMDGRIYFLGYVQNMAFLYGISDLVISTSRSEGLPFNVMEAMASGQPVIASKIKGHADLLGAVDRLQDYFLYDLGDKQSLARIMFEFFKDAELRKRVGSQNQEEVQRYKIERVKPLVMAGYGENK